MKRKMSDNERVFWGKYAGTLVEYGVFGKNAEWHVRRAQEFVHGLDGLRLNAVDCRFAADAR